jgi:hypothetical protein
LNKDKVTYVLCIWLIFFSWYATTLQIESTKQFRIDKAIFSLTNDNMTLDKVSYNIKGAPDSFTREIWGDYYLARPLRQTSSGLFCLIGPGQWPINRVNGRLIGSRPINRVDRLLSWLRINHIICLSIAINCQLIMIFRTNHKFDNSLLILDNPTSKPWFAPIC